MEINKIELPKIGDAVLRDGYKFIVKGVRPHTDINIVASIRMRGEAGEVEVGYYDYIRHEKAI